MGGSIICGACITSYSVGATLAQGWFTYVLIRHLIANRSP